MLRKFPTWAKTDCDECGIQYQVTRTEPKELTSCICSDCDLYAKAFEEGRKLAVESNRDIQKFAKILFNQGYSLGMFSQDIHKKDEGYELMLRHCIDRTIHEVGVIRLLDSLYLSEEIT